METRSASWSVVAMEIGSAMCNLYCVDADYRLPYLVIHTVSISIFVLFFGLRVRKGLQIIIVRRPQAREGPPQRIFRSQNFRPRRAVVHVLLVATDAPHELRVFLDRRARRFQGLQGQRLGADLDVDLDRRAERSP